MKKIRSFISIVLALSLLIGLIPSGAFAAPESRRVPFSDVKSTDWFYEPVEYAYENGLMTGTGSSTFSPNLTTTRGMIVTILHRMEGEPDAARAAFNDVSRSRYYAEAIDWANANGIVSGYGGGRFGPDDPITREQMASIMYRYSEYKGYDTSASASLNRFKDGSSVSNYAKDVMRWAVGSGLLSGRTADTLAPQGQTTRAEAATILMRYCETIAAASEETFTVTFDSAGGSHVASQEVKSGGQAKEPADPTRDGYKFIGWQLENAFGLYNFDASIFADITLVAQWEADDFEAAHEEFESKDIYDFDADRVLQVEESNTEDNFAVVAEDVELIKDDGVTNQVNIASRATDVYVLSNITDDVRSLQPGDKLMLVSDSNVDNNISVSVENITFAGNTATISSEGSSLEDFYEYIDIEKLYPAEEEHVEILSSMDISDTPIEGEGGIEVASAPDLLDRSLVGKAIGGGVTVSEEFEASLIYPKDAKKEDALITGSTSAAIALSVDVEWAPKIFSEDYLRCDVIANLSAVNDYDINFLNVQKDISVPLYSIKMPLGVTGLVVEGDIDLTAGCSGYLHGSFDSIYSKNIGFSYNTNDGYHEVNETEKDDASIIVDAKATANIGLGADLTLSAVTVLGATMRTELGAEAEVTGEKDFLADNSDHRCFLCFDGDLGLYAEGRFILRATIFDIEEEFLNEELYHATVPLGEFYCSLLNEGGAYSFGWGECPYKSAGVGEEEKPSVEGPGLDAQVEPTYYWDFSKSLNEQNGTPSKVYGDTKIISVNDPGIGKAAYFDGDGDYIECGNGMNLTDNYTFNTYLYCEDVDMTYSNFFAKYEVNQKGSYAFAFRHGKINVWVTERDGVHTEIENETELKNNTWYYISVVKSGTNYKIYINGKLDGEGNIPTFVTTDDTVTIGRQALMFAPVDQLQFNGYIREISIYENDLSAEEIGKLYQQYNRYI